MNNHKGWIEIKRKAAEPEAPEAPALDKAPEAPAAPATVPLDEADKNRAPAPPNPTGNPEPAKPMSIGEVMRLLEAASKSLIDAGLDSEKASSSLLKVRAMAGASEKERQIMQKTGDFANKVGGLKDQISALAMAISEYRDTLGSGVQSWLDPK